MYNLKYLLAKIKNKYLLKKYRYIIFYHILRSFQPVIIQFLVTFGFFAIFWHNLLRLVVFRQNLGIFGQNLVIFCKKNCKYNFSTVQKQMLHHYFFIIGLLAQLVQQWSLNFVCGFNSYKILFLHFVHPKMLTGTTRWHCLVFCIYTCDGTRDSTRGSTRGSTRDSTRGSTRDSTCGSTRDSTRSSTRGGTYTRQYTQR